MENKEVYFEGVKIKPTKAGFYKCPFGCHTNTGYPAPKWKTEKGFIRHLEKCNMRPSLIKIKEDKQQEKLKELNNRKDILESLKDEFLKTFNYKIGDSISFVKRIVVKDTHEWRWNRSVKVRYEPILKFEAVRTNISSINFSLPEETPTIENISKFVYFNNGIYLSEILKYEDAVRIAKEKTLSDEIYREECFRCRD
jgi:hypothetical protein